MVRVPNRSLEKRELTGQILLPAEGEGRNAVYAAKRGLSVYAFDISSNAKKKALENAAKMGMLVLADDTGLFVDALRGRPGVYSARYAGEGCSYKDNRNKMLVEMKDKTNRHAHFATVVALASPNEIVASVLGEVNGTITEVEFGEGGFGYDPIFRADETGKTFGEMSSEAKHKISHRARALAKIVPLLKEYLEEIEEED